MRIKLNYSPFLAEFLAKLNLDGVKIVSTNANDVVSSQPLDKSGIAPCNHEEADTRLLLHVAHASRHRLTKVLIKTVDADVVILVLTNFYRLGMEELWIAFGVGKHFRYIPAHQVACSLGQAMCEALPFFHADTGCDPVFSFCGRGKYTAYAIWKAFPDITPLFYAVSTMLSSVTEEYCQELERFVVLLYSRTCPLKRVNEARQSLFAQGNIIIENIPPSQVALLEHLKRAEYQAGHVWGQSFVSIQNLPNADEYSQNLQQFLIT